MIIMIGKNILFSLITSSVITVLVYLFNRDKYKENENISEIITLFVISSIVVFIGKVCTSDTNVYEGNSSVTKSVSNKCPF